jgi:hypothetical protein
MSGAEPMMVAVFGEVCATMLAPDDLAFHFL